MKDENRKRTLSIAMLESAAILSTKSGEPEAALDDAAGKICLRDLFRKD